MNTVNIKHIAKIARISLKEEELKPKEEFLNNMLKWFNEILVLDVKNTKAIYNTSALLTNDSLFAKDIAIKEAETHVVLQNATNKKDTLLIVPKVIN